MTLIHFNLKQNKNKAEGDEDESAEEEEEEGAAGGKSGDSSEEDSEDEQVHASYFFVNICIRRQCS